MKKIILGISLAFVFIGVDAQQAEIDATNAAFKSKNYTEALAQASKADATLSNDRSIEPDVLSEFYLNAANAAKASGDMMVAAKYYAKLGELENSTLWKAKNKNSKKWEYFYDDAEAKKITSAGNYGKLREASLSKRNLSSVIGELNNEANTALNSGNDAFKAQSYEDAGNNFLKAYYLYQAVGKENDLLKYYSALSFLQTEDKAKAANMLQELVDDGFTGVTTNYYATDKEGNKVAFASKADLDTQVKLGLVSQPEVETTESLEEDLYSNTTFAWYALEDWDKALEIGEAGLKKFPGNTNMNQLVAGTYFKTGNVEKFVANLRAKVENGTATAEDYFNLAKSIEDANGDIEEAKSYYLKSIESNPEYGDAYLNLAFAIIQPEKEYVAIMNQNLGSSAKEKKIYKTNQAKRKALYQEAVPYLEKAYKVQPNNITLIKILRTTYDVLGDDDNYTKFKKLYDQQTLK